MLLTFWICVSNFCSTDFLSSVLSVLHLLALVWTDVWVLWALTLHNRNNKGSFLCKRTEAHLWAPTASPLPALPAAAPAVGPIGWKSPPGFFLWHTERCVPGHMPATAALLGCLCSSGALGQLKNCSGRHQQEGCLLAGWLASQSTDCLSRVTAPHTQSFN